MTARTRWLDYVLLAGGVWLAWVLLFQWAGPEALSPPGATLRRAGEYLASATFWPHAAATARCLRLCLPDRADGRAGARVRARCQSPGRAGGRADPVVALFHSQDHALSRHPAGVRARDFRQGRVRRLAWILSGRALHHRRAEEYESGADQDRARASPRAARDGAHGAVAGGAAGDRHRASYRLLGHAARHPDR